MVLELSENFHTWNTTILENSYYTLKIVSYDLFENSIELISSEFEIKNEIQNDDSPSIPTSHSGSTGNPDTTEILDSESSQSVEETSSFISIDILLLIVPFIFAKIKKKKVHQDGTA